jgi:hypothetical protein
MLTGHFGQRHPPPAHRSVILIVLILDLGSERHGQHLH